MHRQAAHRRAMPEGPNRRAVRPRLESDLRLAGLSLELELPFALMSPGTNQHVHQ